MNNTTYFSYQFDWLEKSRTFITEASRLGIPPGQPPAKVIQVVSSTLGKKFDLFFTRVDWNGGEIAGWRYETCPANIQAIITND